MNRLRTALLSFILSVFIMFGGGCNRAENELQSGLIAEPSHFYLPPDKEMTTPVFFLVNRSREVIHILDVKSSCGCASPKLPTSQVLPGQRIELSVNAIRPLVGANSATVTLRTDSPITPVVAMTATMAAKGDGDASVFQIEPRRIVLQRRNGVDSPSGGQILSIKSIERAQGRFVKAVECGLAGVIIREHQVAASTPVFGSSFVERHYQFLIEIDPKCPVGSYFGNITLNTGGEKTSGNHRTAVNLIVDGNIVATPRSVFASVSDSEMLELPKWNVRLTAAFGRIEIESIDASAEWLTTSVTNPNVSSDDNPESSYAIVQINVTSVPKGAAVQSEVVVRTTDQEEIRIPVVLTRPRQFSPISAE